LWKEFQQFQAETREYYFKRNRFLEYKNAIRESQEDCSANGISLCTKTGKQDQLQDWNEFRAFYYRRLKEYEKKLEPAEHVLLCAQKKLGNAEPGLACSAFETGDSSWGRVIQAEKRMEDVKSRVKAAERKL